MAFGIIHYMFLLDTIVMVVCVILLLRKYLMQKNLLTMIFTLFLITFTLLCLTYFSRGFFDVNTFESIMNFKISLIPTIFSTILLATFIFYPILVERGGFKEGREITLLLVILWVAGVVSSVLVFIGEATLRFSVLSFDVYSVTYGAVSYLMILLTPILTAVICIIMFLMMALRESEQFYRVRALFLFFGWMLALIGQLTLLVESLVVLNPILFGTGALLMAIAILRQPPQ